MLYKSLIISLLLCFLSIGIYWAYKSEKFNNEIIRVEINLINNCELFDKAFMVKALPSNKVAKFKDKRAVMFLSRKSKVKLEANKEFPGFHFSSLQVKVNKNIDLIADCSESERLDNIFESLKNQFNKNSN